MNSVHPRILPHVEVNITSRAGGAQPQNDVRAAYTGHQEANSELLQGNAAGTDPRAAAMVRGMIPPSIVTDGQPRSGRASSSGTVRTPPLSTGSHLSTGSGANVVDKEHPLHDACTLGNLEKVCSNTSCFDQSLHHVTF